jgi:hypothetical protein
LTPGLTGAIAVVAGAPALKARGLDGWGTFGFDALWLLFGLLGGGGGRRSGVILDGDAGAWGLRGCRLLGLMLLHGGAFLLLGGDYALLLMRGLRAVLLGHQVFLERRG